MKYYTASRKEPRMIKLELNQVNPKIEKILIQTKGIEGSVPFKTVTFYYIKSAIGLSR